MRKSAGVFTRLAFGFVVTVLNLAKFQNIASGTFQKWHVSSQIFFKQRQHLGFNGLFLRTKVCRAQPTDDWRYQHQSTGGARLIMAGRTISAFPRV